MEIQMGGGSLNLEILRGGGLKQFWKSRWEGGGVQKTEPSVVGEWIFSGITQLKFKFTMGVPTSKHPRLR